MRSMYEYAASRGFLTVYQTGVDSIPVACPARAAWLQNIAVGRCSEAPVAEGGFHARYLGVTFLTFPWFTITISFTSAQ